jgi:hypothetical protein
MREVGGRGEWCLGEGAGGHKIWDGQGEGWCMGCGWGMVVVAYVGETVHVRASQLQGPTHRPQNLVRCREKQVLVRVSSRQRDALYAGCDETLTADEEDPPN